MKLISIIFGILFFNACDAQHKKTETKYTNTECNFSFEELNQCSYRYQSYEIIIDFTSESIAEDERKITELLVKLNGIQQILKTSPDTTLFDGDIGHISFSDINFDGIPDLAITTSFGTSNLYLDYWVFNIQQKKYIFVGNYPQFTIDDNEKKLKATIKNNAADYQSVEWHWKSDTLEKVN
jgi:hypothetical protein